MAKKRIKKKQGRADMILTVLAKLVLRSHKQSVEIEALTKEVYRLSIRIKYHELYQRIYNKKEGTNDEYYTESVGNGKNWKK